MTLKEMITRRERLETESYMLRQAGGYYEVQRAVKLEYEVRQLSSKIKRRREDQLDAAQMTLFGER